MHNAERTNFEPNTEKHCSKHLQTAPGGLRSEYLKTSVSPEMINPRRSGISPRLTFQRRDLGTNDNDDVTRRPLALLKV
ncbi:hypothetical protein PABG_11986 [Paracoccidioides brasiliensis Pb03]|nr:hypothetical protein PABG_11986 [Paracoccidioides brasiliensis Pb03]